MKEGTPMTPAELSEILWGNYPKHEKRANYKFLTEVFRSLRLGGIWAWPNAGRVFKKINEDELIEIYE
jgi:hypothetical protein